MANAKLTALTELATSPAATDILYIVDDPGVTPLSKKITVANLLAASRSHADNIKAIFGTGSDAEVYYDGTDLIIDPDAVGSGALKVTGNFDLEGYGAIGNGQAVVQSTTLHVSRSFTAPSGVGAQLVTSGIITGFTDNEIDHVAFIPGGSITAGSGTIDRVSTLKLVEPIITAGTNTITNAVTLYIQDAPTEGDDNYALFVDAGDCRFDGQVLAKDGLAASPSYSFASDTDMGIRLTPAIGVRFVIAGVDILQVDSNGIGGISSAGPKLNNETSSATNPTLIPDQTELASGIGGTGNNVSIISSGVEVITVGNNTLGLFATTPAAQPAHIADPAGGAVIDVEARAALVLINAAMATLGITAAV